VHLGLRREPLEWKLLGAAAVIGLVVDTTLAATDLIRFSSAWTFPLAPAWMLALWVAFATTLNHSLRWLMSRPAAAALGGALGGPLAYLAGEKIGALSLNTPAVALATCATLWAGALLCLSLLMRTAQPAPTQTVPA
jgi:hypothetical protein